MGRLRSLVRRAAKPAAMVGAVGILSLSLVVTTPTNAQAFVDLKEVTPTRVMGAVKTVAPVAMAAASFTPVGFGLRLAQLAFLAYSTSDMWMPFVTGAFGQSTLNENELAEPSETVGIIPDMSLSIPTMVANGYSYTWSYSGPATTNGLFKVQRRIKCRVIATGATYIVNNAAQNSYGKDYKSGTQTVNCTNSSDAPVGMVAGSINAAPELGGTKYAGPANVVRLGDYASGEPGFDPRGADVTYRGGSQCIDGVGTVSWLYAPDVAGNNGAMLMPSCEAAGKGHGTGRSTVTAFKPDGTQETVWDTGASPLSDPATPLCDPGLATSGCLMEVTKDGQPCATGDVECENWASESKKEGNTRYGCKLGPYTLPLSACSLLEQAYVPGGSPLNDENTDGNPDTRSPLGPSGVPAPAPAPVTTGTGTGTTPGGVPGGSGQTGPGADEKTRSCFPTGWATFNPVEWVLKPLRCAFEPSSNPQDMVTRLGIRSATKAPISFLNLEMVGPSGGSCPNWVINVPGFSQNVVCGSSFTAALLSVRGPLFGLVATAMVWPLIRSLWYAAIPILRVTPSSGGK